MKMQSWAAIQLEDLVVQYGLGSILTELAEICALNAQHARQHPQDEKQARRWEKAAKRVLSAAGSDAVLGLPL